MKYDKDWVTVYTPQRCIADYYSDYELANRLCYKDIIDLITDGFKDTEEYKSRFEYNMKHIKKLRKKVKREFEENLERSEAENMRFGNIR